jgi:signal peptidase II
VDYFSIEFKRLKKVIFNLGDIFVFLGSLVFLIGELLEDIDLKN